MEVKTASASTSWFLKAYARKVGALKTYQYIEFEKKFDVGKGIFQIRKFYLEKILEQSFYHEN